MPLKMQTRVGYLSCQRIGYLHSAVKGPSVNAPVPLIGPLLHVPWLIHIPPSKVMPIHLPPFRIKPICSYVPSIRSRVIPHPSQRKPLRHLPHSKIHVHLLHKTEHIKSYSRWTWKL